MPRHDVRPEISGDTCLSAHPAGYLLRLRADRERVTCKQSLVDLPLVKPLGDF
jgi:hypothetical protein